MESIRIQKYLSQSWICSRRKAEEYISQGLIFVNGEKAHIGQSIDPNVDKVEMWKKAIQEQKELLYFKLNKPRGIVTTCAQWDERNIIDILDIDKRVFPIGRLDKDTTWLILLTNDGRLANYLMHPKYNHEKEYIVETFWPIDDEALEKMRKWVFILWRYTKRAKIERIAAGKYSITISEWRNRQVRRMAEAVGKKVKKLKRVRIENIFLEKLKEWEYKALSSKEKKDLFEKLNIQ